MYNKKATKIPGLSRRQSKEKSGMLAYDVAYAGVADGMLVHGVPSRKSARPRAFWTGAGTVSAVGEDPALLIPQCSKNAGSWFLLAAHSPLPTDICRCCLLCGV